MQDFEPKDIIGDAVTRMNTRLNEKSRGDVVTWEEFEAEAGFDRESPHFTQFLKRVRRDILDSRGIKLFPVPGVGLKLMTNREQVMDLSRHKRARRQQTRAIRELKALRDDELTEQHRKVKYVKIEQARAARRTCSQSIRLGTMLTRPSNTGMPKPVATK